MSAPITEAHQGISWQLQNTNLITRDAIDAAMKEGAK